MLTLHKKGNFAIRTLQNEDILHFFTKKFAYIKKKLYLCSEFKNLVKSIFNILTIRYNSQITTKCITTKIMPL